MAAALALKLAWLWLQPLIGAEWQPLIYRLTEPRQKLPPGAGYLLWFGGAGVTMMGLLGLASSSALGRRVQSFLAVLGRASLIVFIAQYFVFYVPAKTFNVGKGYWPILFPASLAVLWSIAWTWDRYNGNRWLTLGLRRVGLETGGTRGRVSMAARAG